MVLVKVKVSSNFDESTLQYATLVKTTSSKLQHTGQIQLNMKNHNYSSSIVSLHCSEENVATSAVGS